MRAIFDTFVCMCHFAGVHRRTLELQLLLLLLQITASQQIMFNDEQNTKQNGA